MADEDDRIKLVVALVNEIFSSDSESSEEDELEDAFIMRFARTRRARGNNARIPRIQNYVEEVVPRYSPTTFREHFRLNPSTFEYVLLRIGQSICNTNEENVGRATIPPHKQLLLSLWYFATPDSYRSVVDRFDVGRATAVRIVRRVTHALFDLAPEVIVWPTGPRVEDVTAGFQKMSNFPGIIGAVDGSHIPIPAPALNPQSYYNRKGFHSILLQGVCDHKARFTHCYAGEVGSVHDARVFRLSELQSFIDHDSDRKFPHNTHLVGDPAYVCQPQVMVPYKENGHLTVRQQNFNYCQSSSRCVIERAFAQLKGRLRCLKFLAMSDVAEIPKLIIACCVLHNICITQGDDASEYEPENLTDGYDVNDEDEVRHNNENVIGLQLRGGQLKRIQITEMLPLRQQHPVEA